MLMLVVVAVVVVVVVAVVVRATFITVMTISCNDHRDYS